MSDVVVNHMTLQNRRCCMSGRILPFRTRHRKYGMLHA